MATGVFGTLNDLYGPLTAAGFPPLHNAFIHDQTGITSAGHVWASTRSDGTTSATSPGSTGPPFVLLGDPFSLGATFTELTFADPNELNRVYGVSGVLSGPFTITDTPEPGTLAMAGLGSVLLSGIARVRRQSRYNALRQ